MIRRIFFKTLGLAGVSTVVNAKQSPISDRKYWINKLEKIAFPVLQNLANDTLRSNMPVEGKMKDRPTVTHLEAFGRLLTGIAPWLNLEDFSDKTEKKLRDKFFALTQKAIDNGTNSQSKDYFNFTKNYQPLVDAAFLANGLIRAPRLWESLPQRVKENTLKALLSTRDIRPGFNNWLLFSAMIEAFFAKFGYDYDKMRLDYAIRQHEQWFMGDGIYGDGPNFHWDYYNSYVIQPFLVDIIGTILPKEPIYKDIYASVSKRATRYAAIQERLIGQDGTFPVIGRSIAYRAGAFQHLANTVLLEQLPENVSPQQVRCALTAVLKQTLEPSGTFDSNGWLQIGLHGHQPAIGEYYISTGSLYLCSSVFLPLGLSDQHPFWSGPATDWTAKKVWNGFDLPVDHAD